MKQGAFSMSGNDLSDTAFGVEISLASQVEWGERAWHGIPVNTWNLTMRYTSQLAFEGAIAAVINSMFSGDTRILLALAGTTESLSECSQRIRAHVSRETDGVQFHEVEAARVYDMLFQLPGEQIYLMKSPGSNLSAFLARIVAERRRDFLSLRGREKGSLIGAGTALGCVLEVSGSSSIATAFGGRADVTRIALAVLENMIK